MPVLLNETVSQDAYTAAGVSQRDADSAVAALVAHLAKIDTGKPSRVVPLPGHYASVLRLDERTGIAFGTDGVGTKMVVAEQLGRFETIGIDCIAMNVNDLICVGAEPIAMLDFILCANADPAICGQIGKGLRAGAEQAGIEIPGGEIAQVGDVVSGWELTGSAIGLVALDRIVSGERIEAGDALIGLPSSGLHSNGYTLARRVLADVPFEDTRLGAPLGDVLLEPTTIYVRAVLELLRSDVINAADIAAGRTPGAREMSVAFADLVGFTRLGEQIPAEDLGDVVSRLESVTAELVARPVTFVKTVGDAVMLVAPEPDPLIDVGLRLIEEDFEQPIRVGIACGAALERAGDWYGSPVNQASRVTTVARPGSVLATQGVRDTATGDWRWSFARERRLKGVGEVKLHRARRPSSAD